MKLQPPAHPASIRPSMKRVQLGTEHEMIEIWGSMDTEVAAPDTIWTSIGIITSLACSALAGGLGNTLGGSISVLVYVHLILATVAWHQIIMRTFHSSSRLYLLQMSVVVIALEGAGTCLGFSSIFSYPEPTIQSIFQAFAYGCLAWACYILLALLPASLLPPTTPAWLSLLAMPVLYTAVSQVLLGELSFSSFASVGNAALDYEPLRQMCALGGISLVTFVVVLGSNACARLYIDSPHPERFASTQVFVLYGAAVLAALLSYSAFRPSAEGFYQRDVSTLIRPTLNASCIFAQGIGTHNEADREGVWGNTLARVRNGDAIVLWAEESFSVHSAEDEAAVLARAQRIIQDNGNGRTYLGIAYLKHLPGETLGTNHFVLIGADGAIAWDYLKANPVPLVEADIAAGPRVLPTHDSIYGLRLGGAICFDFDYTDFIRQAGEKSVDVMLQPSWTWAAIHSRAFDGNAVRAIENGVSILRCSSDGESGVISPYGKVYARQLTGHDPAAVVTFSLPVQKRVATLYTLFGYAFNGLVSAGALLIYVYLGVQRWLAQYHQALLPLGCPRGGASGRSYSSVEGVELKPRA